MKGEIMLSQIEMKYYKDVTRIADCLERIADAIEKAEKEDNGSMIRRKIAELAGRNGGDEDE